MNTQDYADEDTEEAVLSRWGKIKAWWEMGSAVVQVIKYGILAAKILFVGSATAVVVGEVTDTSPVRDAAVEVGVLQPDINRASQLARNDEQDEEIEQLKAALERLKGHQHNYADPEVVTGPRGPQGAAGIDGKDGVDGKDGLDGAAGATQIDDAFNRHKLDDH